MDKNKVLAIVAIIFAIIAVYLIYSPVEEVEVTDFLTCAAVGNPVMESYPRQCRDSGNLYIEDISWRNDQIELRKNQETDFYACFGCGDRICIDPAQNMVKVTETKGRHCNSDFEIVGS